LTQNDPTDHALAAIASILDAKDRPEDQAEDQTALAERAADDETGVVVAERVTVTVEKETVIAELDAPSTAPEPSHDAPEVDGYTRLGPGPLDAIRFRWTARRDEDGQYFVDETIGAHSHPISSGPMPQSEVIDFINARESAARERFQALKQQMTLSREPLRLETINDD
jgi:hypothetical protein